MHLSFSAISFLLTSLFPHLGSTSPTPVSPTASLVYQFPIGTWLENIAVRSNGQVIVTVLSTPDLYLIDPSVASPTPTLLASFPKVGLLGITETQNDLFYVIAGNDSVSTGVHGSAFSIYSVDLRARTSSKHWHYSKTKADPEKPTVAKVADIDAKLANGITPLSATDLLIADSTAGSVIILNTNTGISSILLSEPEMIPAAGAPAPVGINGVKLYPSFSSAPLDGGKRYLYFTNSFKMTLYRIPISASTGAKLGAVETVVNGSFMDDFAIREADGTVFIASNGGNSVLETTLDGKALETVVGSVDADVVPGSTAIAFGRRREDGTLFVTTSGMWTKSDGTTTPEGGKVVAVKGI